MNLSPRYLRRIINKFIKEAEVDIKFGGGGCVMSFPGGAFTLREHAIWHRNSHIIEYTFIGEDWLMRALDTSNNGKRQLQVVGQGGNIDSIEPTIRAFAI